MEKHMKKILFLAAACLALTTLAPSSQAAPTFANGVREAKPTPVQNETLDFELTNQIQLEGTSLVIEEVWIAPHSQVEWGDNILEAGLDYDDSASVTFHPEAEATCWDMAVKVEGVEAPFVWTEGFDLSQVTSIVLELNDEGLPSAAVTPAGSYGCGEE
jgi:hypothetical protein